MKLYDKTAEFGAILSLCNGDAHTKAKLFGSLTSEHFHDDDAFVAFKRVLVLVKQRGEVPSFRELISDPIIPEESRAALAKHKHDVAVSDFDSAFQNLNKFRQLRGLYNTVETIDKAFNSDSIDTEKLLDEVTTRITNIRNTSTNKDAFLNFGKGGNSIPTMRELLDQEEESFIPTGIEAFDNLNGGFFYGSLVTLGATSGGGKSAVSLNININMSLYAQEDTVFVPLEMSKGECTARMMARLSGVPHLKILMKKLTEEEIKRIKRSWKKFQRRLDETETRCTIFKPQQDMTMEEILMTLKPHGYRMKTIDYISLLKGVDGEGSWDKLGAAARYAKIDAETTTSVNCLLVQVNADATVRYARAISEHSSTSLIWTPLSETMENATTVEFDVRQLKGRNSKRTPFRISIDLETMKMIPVEDPYTFAEPNQENKKPKQKRKSGEVGNQKSRVRIDEDGVDIQDKNGSIEQYTEDITR